MNKKINVRVQLHLSRGQQQDLYFLASEHYIFMHKIW